MSGIIFPPDIIFPPKSGCDHDGHLIDTEREPFKTVVNAVNSVLEKNENNKELEKNGNQKNENNETLDKMLEKAEAEEDCLHKTLEDNLEEFGKRILDAMRGGGYRIGFDVATQCDL